MGVAGLGEGLGFELEGVGLRGHAGAIGSRAVLGYSWCLIIYIYIYTYIHTYIHTYIIYRYII